MKTQHLLFGLLRISLGWIFFWPFLDKLFGLGFTACRDSETGIVVKMCEEAWISGGSATSGFLTFATRGPLADLFQLMAGNALVEWLFMLGLLGIGLSLLLGIFTRIAAGAGVGMFMLMYLAVLPPEHNPLIDDHIIYSVVLLLFLFMPVGNWLGFGKQWAQLTNNNPWLR